MKEALQLLIKLQHIDTEIGRINLKKKDLPLQLEILEKSFAGSKSAVQAAETQLEETNKKHRETEDKLKKAIDGLRKAKERLHEVKTNKEYHAILKEIEGMEKKNGEIEEAIIILLDDIDSRRAALKLKNQAFAEEKVIYEAKQQDLQRQIEAIASDLQDRIEKSTELRKTMAPDLLKKYDMIRNINNGLAVVSAWKEVCNGCHMNLPPQMYNELHAANELLLCPQCNRIIYWYDQDANDA